MQSNEYGVLLSASDLMRFAGCAHATTLDLARMRGTGAAPAGDSEDAELLQRHGDAHEARHLARLRAAGRGVVEIVREGVSLAQGVAATRAALERGAEVVFQGALAGGMWGGWSDFLERVDRPSALGALVLRGRRHQAEAQAAPEARAAARALLRPPRRGAGAGARARPCRARRRHPRDDPARRGLGLRPARARAAGGLRRGAGADPARSLRRLPALPLARGLRRASSPRRTASTGWRTSPAGRWRSSRPRASRRWRRSRRGASRCAAWRPRRWRGW